MDAERADLRAQLERAQRAHDDVTQRLMTSEQRSAELVKQLGPGGATAAEREAKVRI